MNRIRTDTALVLHGHARIRRRLFEYVKTSGVIPYRIHRL